MREIRRTNLRILVDEVGSQVDFAAKVEKDKNQIHQWLLDPSQPAARGMRDDTARGIERKCGRPKGWLDHEHDASTDDELGVGLNPATLRSAILVTERAIQAKHLVVTPEARAEITLGAYDLLCEGQSIPNVQRLVARMLQAIGGATVTN